MSVPRWLGRQPPSLILYQSDSIGFPNPYLHEEGLFGLDRGAFLDLLGLGVEEEISPQSFTENAFVDVQLLRVQVHEVIEAESPTVDRTV